MGDIELMRSKRTKQTHVPMLIPQEVYAWEILNQDDLERVEQFT